MNPRSDRQSFLGDDHEMIIQSTPIAIIGLCGGGSHIAQQLAHIGFIDFIICDFDHVEYSNLSRMVGAIPSDASNGVKKTAVIQRMINDINPDATVRVIDGPWQSKQEALRDRTVIFGCVDSISVRDELERFCRRFLIAYIDIGMDVHKHNEGYSISGQSIVSLPLAPCMRCLGLINDAAIGNEQKQYGAAGGKPQVVWPNGVLASLAISQLMSLILPWSNSVEPSIMLEYDGNRHTVRDSFKLPILEQKVCPHYGNATDIGDPFY